VFAYGDHRNRTTTIPSKEKSQKLAREVPGTISPVRFEGGSCGIAAISSDSQKNAARFLYNPDCVAERAV
jgi:hypothetical protein